MKTRVGSIIRPCWDAGDGPAIVGRNTHYVLRMHLGRPVTEGGCRWRAWVLVRR